MAKSVPLSEFARHNWKATPSESAGNLIGAVWVASVILTIWAFLGRATSLGIVLVLLVAVVSVALFVRIQIERAGAQTINRANQIDFEAANALTTEVSSLNLKNLAVSDANSSRFTSFRGSRLGEITRHFDSQTTASIEGWMDHNLSGGGYAVGEQVGQVGFGVFQVGIGGQSTVHLNLTGTTRNDLLGDGFVAVLEQDLPGGGIDTLRVVVPSETASRELVTQFVTSLGTTFEKGSHRDVALSASTLLVRNCFRTDVGYVSDRLNALLRMPQEMRSRINVIGDSVTEHALLGGALQFDGEGSWYQLFPLGLIQHMTELVRITNGELPTTNVATR